MDDERRLAIIARLKQRGVFPEDDRAPTARELRQADKVLQEDDAAREREAHVEEVLPPAVEEAPEDDPQAELQAVRQELTVATGVLDRQRQEVRRHDDLLAYQEAQLATREALLDLVNPGHLYPWDRLPEETDQQWAAFQIYRDTPPVLRSLSEAARRYYRARHELGEDEDLEGRGGISNALLRWATDHSWADRVRAYDTYQDKLQQAKWVARRLEQREKEWEMRDALLKRADDMLRFPLAQVVTESKDGKSVTQIFPTKWKLGDVVTFLKLAMRMGRDAANMAGAPQNLSVDELDEQIAAELARLSAADQDALLAEIAGQAEAD